MLQLVCKNQWAAPSSNPKQTPKTRIPRTGSPKESGLACICCFYRTATVQPAASRLHFVLPLEQQAVRGCCQFPVPC